MAESIASRASYVDFHGIRSGANWIKYPRAERILHSLNELLAMRPYHRMPNLIVAGPTNNGKTSIVRRFFDNHPGEVHLAPGVDSMVPVIMLQVPDVPDVNAVYNKILAELMVPFRPTARLDERRRKALAACELMRVRMIVLDEFHHIASATPTKQREVLQMVKYLGNELMIPIVAVGTREAFNAIKRDPQLANRFDPALLPRWTLDDEFLSLLATFATLLPDEMGAQLTSEPVARLVLSLSEGTIGEVARLIASAGQYASARGTVLNCAALKACSYISQDRRNRADGID